MQVKQLSEKRKKIAVVYEVHCKDCECVYIEETNRTVEKRLNKHKNVVKNMTQTQLHTSNLYTVVFPSIPTGYHHLKTLHAHDNCCYLIPPLI